VNAMDKPDRDLPDLRDGDRRRVDTRALPKSKVISEINRRIIRHLETAVRTYGIQLRVLADNGVHPQDTKLTELRVAKDDAERVIEYLKTGRNRITDQPQRD